MNIVGRNFFRLLRSGTLNEFETIEPMSTFKWRRLNRMAIAHGVAEIIYRGMQGHSYDKENTLPANIKNELLQNAQSYEMRNEDNESLQLHDSEQFTQGSSPLLKQRLEQIRQSAQTAPPPLPKTLELLNLIIDNTETLINQTMPLQGIGKLALFLRTQGEEADYVQLEKWLQQLHLQKMADLIGSLAMEIYQLQQDELPFITQQDPNAKTLVEKTLKQTCLQDAAQWKLHQTGAGFSIQNSAALRRDLSRSIRFFRYAPLETTCAFFKNFARGLSEIEE